MAQPGENAQQALMETWSPRVLAALQRLGDQRWPPHRQKQGFLKRPRLLPRFAIEGPLVRGGEILWAVSHTISPSTFDLRGTLTEGVREYWLVGLSAMEPPTLRIEGAQTLGGIPASEEAFQAALVEALAAGPRHDTFYGNRGPLSHRTGGSAK